MKLHLEILSELIPIERNFIMEWITVVIHDHRGKELETMEFFICLN